MGIVAGSRHHLLQVCSKRCPLRRLCGGIRRGPQGTPGIRNGLGFVLGLPQHEAGNAQPLRSASEVPIQIRANRANSLKQCVLRFEVDHQAHLYEPDDQLIPRLSRQVRVRGDKPRRSLR